LNYHCNGCAPVGEKLVYGRRDVLGLDVRETRQPREIKKRIFLLRQH
jgi:hypothetical protein